MWQGGGVLFLIAQMSQDSIDDVLVLNAGDNFYGSTATTANLDIDIEYTFQSLSPGHRGMLFGGSANLRIFNLLHTFTALCWRDQPATVVIRCENVMVTGEVNPRTFDLPIMRILESPLGSL